MAFFKRMDIGRIYVIKLVLPDGLVVHKVGMCNSSRSTDRMMEILRSWFNKFRFVPYAELRLDMECHNPRKIEAYIHKILRPVSFTPTYKVQGHTEMFCSLDETKLICFLKSVNNSVHNEFEDLTTPQCRIICKLLMDKDEN